MRSRAILRGIFLLLGLFLLSQGAFATTTWLPIPQFFNTVGVPLAGGQVFTYAAGTTTPQPSYTDSTGLVQNPNPVILDSTGKPTQGIWLSSAGYKIVVEDSNNNIQWFQDNYIQGSSSSSTAFSAITAATNSNAGSFIASGNTWNFTGASAFLVPLSAGCVPTASASICYDSTNNKYVFGQNGSTVSFGLSSSACATHTWVSTPATGTAQAICTQPAFTDISGTIASAQVPALTNTALTTPSIGGVTITNVPQMTWGATAVGFSVVGTLIGNPIGTFPVNSAITVKNFTLAWGTTFGGCTTTDQWVLQDNGGTIDTISMVNNTNSYTHNLSINVAAGHTLTIVQTRNPSGGCTGSEQNGGFTVVYIMQ